MKKILWWILTIVCGFAAAFGVLLTAMGSVELFYLLSGRVISNMEQPGIPAVASYLSAGVVLMIAGLKAPRWLDIDRLL